MVGLFGIKYTENPTPITKQINIILSLRSSDDEYSLTSFIINSDERNDTIETERVDAVKYKEIMDFIDSSAPFKYKVRTCPMISVTNVVDEVVDIFPQYKGRIIALIIKSYIKGVEFHLQHFNLNENEQYDRFYFHDDHIILSKADDEDKITFLSATNEGVLFTYTTPSSGRQGLLESILQHPIEEYLCVDFTEFTDPSAVVKMYPYLFEKVDRKESGDIRLVRSDNNFMLSKKKGE